MTSLCLIQIVDENSKLLTNIHQCIKNKDIHNMVCLVKPSAFQHL